MKALLVVFVAACGSQNCPTYADAQIVMQASCLDCHSAEVKGPNRQGAPRDSNYDTYEQTKKSIDVIITRAQTSGSRTMPPPTSSSERLTSAQLQTLSQWKSCGSPE